MTPPITCAACGEDHAEQGTAIRVGIAFIARECSWTLRYPGKAAHEVIEDLERRIGGASAARADTAPASPPLDEAQPQAPAADVPEDPAERAGGEFAESKPCPVCNGDGEVPDPEDPESFNPCGRCGGDGVIRVTGG